MTLQALKLMRYLLVAASLLYAVSFVESHKAGGGWICFQSPSQALGLGWAGLGGHSVVSSYFRKGRFYPYYLVVRVSLCRKVQLNKNRLSLPTRHWARQQGFRYRETQAHSLIGERAHRVFTDTTTTDSVVEGGRRELLRGWTSVLRTLKVMAGGAAGTPAALG